MTRPTVFPRVLRDMGGYTPPVSPERTVYRIVPIILLVATTAFADDDWPGFLGPSHNNHASPTTLPTKWSETENIKWKTAIPGEGWSSPVIFDNQIWMTTALNEGRSLRAVCVDKTTGQIVHNIEVFTPTDPGNRNSFNSYASPTPAIEKGRVYVCFGANGSAAIDTASGQVIWKNTELKIDHMEGPGSSPILHKNLYILNCDGIDKQYVVALNKDTGQIAWKTPRSTSFMLLPAAMRKAFCTPLPITVNGKEQLISLGAYNGIAYDPDTGKELWSCSLAGFSNVARPVYADGMLYVSTGHAVAQFWAIRADGAGNVTKTHIAWKFKDSSCILPTPLLIDGRIFMPMDNGVVRCLDPKTGQQIWQSRLGNAFVSSPLYANGLIYLCSTKGLTTVLRPGGKPDPIAENRLDGRFMASPAVSGNALFLRTDTHLYRVEN